MGCICNSTLWCRLIKGISTFYTPPYCCFQCPQTALCWGIDTNSCFLRELWVSCFIEALINCNSAGFSNRCQLSKYVFITKLEPDVIVLVCGCVCVVPVLNIVIYLKVWSVYIHSEILTWVLVHLFGRPMVAVWNTHAQLSDASFNGQQLWFKAAGRAVFIQVASSALNYYC